MGREPCVRLGALCKFHFSAGIFNPPFWKITKFVRAAGKNGSFLRKRLFTFHRAVAIIWIQSLDSVSKLL